MDITRSVYLLILLIGIVFVLIIGKSLIIPIVLAGLIWFLIKEIRKFAKRIPLIKKLPSWLLNVLSVGLLYAISGAIVNMLIKNINALSGNLKKYEENLLSFNESIIEQFGFDISQMLESFIGEFDFSVVLGGILSSLSDLLGNAFMIALYLLFILLEETLFKKKIRAIYTSKDRYKEMMGTFKRISDSISRYIALKTLVSIMTGVLSYIALAIIGIDSPLFWAFLIFILNYIPTIGSLIGTIFPAVIALLQFGDINHAILVLAIVGVIQVVIGNIVEPKMMGNSLNVSSFVVILALSFWGAIWGITGMVLSVPITVILVILFGQFESTKNIAILLSEKGKID